MIVALHGFTGGAESWAAVESACGVPFATPALLGHGAEAPSVETFDEEVDRLAGVIDGPVHLVGYSLGARLALGIALRHPGRVRALSLVGVNPGLEHDDDAQARREADQALAARLERDGLEAFVDFWEALPLFETQRVLPPAVRAAHRERRLGNSSSGLARALRVLGLGAMPPRWNDLPTLSMPVTLVVGELDAKFRALALRALRRIPTCRLEVVRGIGHDVLVEAPVALAKILCEEPWS